MPHKISKRAVRQKVYESVYFFVRDDRRLLGIPEKARDQIVTWAVNEAMGYARSIIDPIDLVDIPENENLVIEASEAALAAGRFAYDSCVKTL